MKDTKYITFQEMLFQYGIEPSLRNNRIYGNLKNSGLVKVKKVSSRQVLYDAESVDALFDFIASQKSHKVSLYQQTAKDIIRHLDPTCPWNHIELGGLCSIGLLNFIEIREANTNSKHPKRYICEESYKRLRELYEKQHDIIQ